MEYSNFNKLISLNKTIHLIGIGGVSMSALAKLLKHLGADVQGSDRVKSQATIDLENRGIRVIYKHEADNVNDTNLIIRTSAIHDDNAEIIRARELNIPILERAEAWGLIMEDYKNVICLSGTHGKTTTTSMMGHILMAASVDPTIMVGSDLPSIDGTIRIGAKSYFVAESCEYCNSFLNFKPTSAVVLNVEEDHLDFFKGIDDIIETFNNFLKLLPSNGIAAINGDDENALKCLENVTANVLTFGLNEKNDVKACNIVSNNGYFTFDVYYKNDFYTTITLSVPGIHNVLNALSCVAVSIHLAIDKAAIAKGLLDFSGSSRRFQKIGSFNDALVVDDYAHHPTEMIVTLKAASQMNFKRVIGIFQPHTYTRTQALWADFVSALKLCDKVIIADIYAAREINTIGISSENFVNELNNAIYIPDFDKICSYLTNEAGAGDLIITMGAGDINKVAYSLCEMA